MRESTPLANRGSPSVLDQKKNGAPEEIRTPDPQIRSLVLYPAELRAHFFALREDLCGAVPSPLGHS
jgi:hypothetical protein